MIVNRSKYGVLRTNFYSYDLTQVSKSALDEMCRLDRIEKDYPIDIKQYLDSEVRAYTVYILACIVMTEIY